MIKVKLCDMALKATSFEIDDLLGKTGEVVERVPDGNWIVQFGHNRVYALPEHYLGETVLEIVFDDTHSKSPEPKVVKKSNVKKRAVAKRKETMKLKAAAESNTVKRTDGRINSK